MKRLLVLTMLMVSLAVYAVNNPVRQATADRLAANTQFGVKVADKHVKRFLKTCGKFCNVRDETEFVLGDMKERQTAAVCVRYTATQLHGQKNFIIIDRQFWADPLRVGVHTMLEEADTARYAIVSHEKLHCIKNLGHRETGLMAPIPEIYRNKEEVDRLIHDEIDYASMGGKYNDINYNGKRFNER